MSNGDDPSETKRLKTDNDQSVLTFSLFNADLLREKLAEHFRKLKQKEESPLKYTETRLYQVDEIFKDDFYWSDRVQNGRFNGSLDRGILYRPKIVDQLLKKVEHVLGLKALVSWSRALQESESRTRW